MDLQKMKQICFDSKVLRNQFVYRIIESGMLDKQIKKIKYDKIQTSMYGVFDNGVTDTYNLFIVNIDKFLMFLDINFILGTTEKFVILSYIFESRYSNIFISKKDINKMRNWYINQYKKLLVDKFFKTLKTMYSQNESILNTIIDDVIDINNMSLKNESDVNKLFDFLKALINCSRNNIRVLFFDASSILDNEMYFEMYCQVFKEYRQKHKYLELLGL